MDSAAVPEAETAFSRRVDAVFGALMAPNAQPATTWQLTRTQVRQGGRDVGAECAAGDSSEDEGTLAIDDLRVPIKLSIRSYSRWPLCSTSGTAAGHCGLPKRSALCSPVNLADSILSSLLQEQSRLPSR